MHERRRAGRGAGADGREPGSTCRHPRLRPIGPAPTASRGEAAAAARAVAHDRPASPARPRSRLDVRDRGIAGARRVVLVVAASRAGRAAASTSSSSFCDARCKSRTRERQRPRRHWRRRIQPDDLVRAVRGRDGGAFSADPAASANAADWRGAAQRAPGRLARADLAARLGGRYGAALRRARPPADAPTRSPRSSRSSASVPWRRRPTLRAATATRFIVFCTAGGWCRWSGSITPLSGHLASAVAAWRRVCASPPRSRLNHVGPLRADSTYRAIALPAVNATVASVRRLRAISRRLLRTGSR